MCLVVVRCILGPAMRVVDCCCVGCCMSFVMSYVLYFGCRVQYIARGVLFVRCCVYLSDGVWCVSVVCD